jgi:glycosyltransferase involved in cell wall biosynthesis
MADDARWSLGGDAVLRSLVDTGFSPDRPDVFLRETRLPSWSRPRVVLAQNALAVANGDLRNHVRRAGWVGRARLGGKTWVAHVNLRRARHIVVLSDAMAGYVRRAIPAAAKRVIVRPVTLPLDLQEYAPDEHTTREPVAVVVASISFHKDLDTIVRALARAMPALDLRQAVIYGEVTDTMAAQRIPRLAAELKVPLRTAITTRPELLRALSRAALVVVPSLLESLGLALPEACIATSAVAASSIAPHRELASRLGAEVDWFEPGDVDAAVAAMLAASDRHDRPAPVPPALASEWRAVADALEVT